MKKTTEKDETQHWVRITRPYFLAAHEVTVGQFRQFVDSKSYQTDTELLGGGYGWNATKGSFEGAKPQYTWRNTGFTQNDHHPVVNVTYNDAVAFCDWLSHLEGKNYRLPTEAEWEYACRGGTTSRYQHGDDPEGLAGVGNVTDSTAKATLVNESRRYITSGDGFVFTAPVGQFRANAFGLWDMHGNVSEWCQDWYGAKYYEQFVTAAAIDPQGDTSEQKWRVIRGGCWYLSPSANHSASRVPASPLYRRYNSGFRVLRGP